MSGSWPAQAHRRGTARPTSLPVAEVEVVAARRGAALALVLRALLRAPVRVLGRGRHLEERDLTDLHPGIERDRQVGHVAELEREVTVPARVDEARGRVDEQAEPAEARLPFEPRDEVV